MLRSVCPNDGQGTLSGIVEMVQVFEGRRVDVVFSDCDRMMHMCVKGRMLLIRELSVLLCYADSAVMTVCMPVSVLWKAKSKKQKAKSKTSPSMLAAKAKSDPCSIPG